uniref:F-box domain-containing protein n=1 Tax=Oryza punctata TaxID=4537 RepID=A0A0E0LIN0_ORYPU
MADGGGGGYDLLTALPDDVLRLPSTAEAARTSVLSRRWRSLWTNLPELRFADVTDLASPPRIRSSPSSTWPRSSSRASSASTSSRRRRRRRGRPGSEARFRSHASRRPRRSPSAYAAASASSCHHPAFDSQYQRDLGDAVSSEVCASLRELCICYADVVSNLAIRSESLRLVQLHRLEGLHQLTISAPVLRELDLFARFVRRIPIAHISAPALETLHWVDLFSSSSVRFDETPNVHRLSAYGIVYGHIITPDSLPLVQHFEAARDVHLTLIHPSDGEVPCSDGCFCYKPRVWENKNIRLNFLQNVEINNLSGAECQIYFVKRLLRWTPVLKTITLGFDPSVTVSEEVSNELLSFSTPGICMEIYLHRDGARSGRIIAVFIATDGICSPVFCLLLPFSTMFTHQNTPSMDAMVDEMSKAYQELVAAAKAIQEARWQPGGENTVTMDAAHEAFEQLRELFLVACDHADVLVQSVLHSVVSDPECFVDGARAITPDEDSVRSPTRYSASSSSSGFSALPDEVLCLILLRLPSAAAAARTSLISRRWRNLWAILLPNLRFPDVTDLARVTAALHLHHASPFLLLHISCSDPAPDKIAAVLDLAAPRLEGELCFDINTPPPATVAASGAAGIGGAIQIPCFEKATEITIRFGGRLGIRLPPSGVFAKLTVLGLRDIRFDSQLDVGVVISSGRCPSLQELRLDNSQVMSNLAIGSASLRLVHLSKLEGMKQLMIFAPVLTELAVSCCFDMRIPIADISAPALETLCWVDLFSWRSVRFSAMPNVHRLAAYGVVYGDDFVQDAQSLPLLQHFKAARNVRLSLVYPYSLVNYEYLIDGISISMLPDNIEILSLILTTRGHTFGPCAFHFLKMSTSIRGLQLIFDDNLEDKVLCSSGCICYKPQDWETMDIFLSFLENVEINRMTGAECDICFVKRLLRWTPVLKTITLIFHPSVTISEEVCEGLCSLSSAGVCMEIYLHRNGVKTNQTHIVPGSIIPQALKHFKERPAVGGRRCWSAGGGGGRREAGRRPRRSAVERRATSGGGGRGRRRRWAASGGGASGGGVGPNGVRGGWRWREGRSGAASLEGEAGGGGKGGAGRRRWRERPAASVEAGGGARGCDGSVWL